MAIAQLTRDERIGLGVAVALHLALVAVLLIRPGRAPVFEPPERMTVNLAGDVGLEATAPDPIAESRAAIAPELAPLPRFQPESAVRPAPAPPRPVATTPPRPQLRATPTSAEPRRRPDTPSSNRQSRPRETSGQRSAGSRIGADFLPGAGDSATTAEIRVPASQIGASAKASIIQSIIRQIKPHWSAPQGADADLLVTVLSFRLNEDGSLNGRPRIIDQSGETASNRPQKDLHAERAIRAVQLAAPFDLPAEYYNAWKSIDGARFDRNLSR